jgi:hypothetical protein
VNFSIGIPSRNAGINGLLPRRPSLTPGQHGTRHFVVQALFSRRKSDRDARNEGDQPDQRADAAAGQGGH